MVMVTHDQEAGDIAGCQLGLGLVSRKLKMPYIAEWDLQPPAQPKNHAAG
jgi:hypothetical protein